MQGEQMITHSRRLIEMGRYAIGSLVLISAALAARGSFAANKLDIADPAPQWTGIVGTDDKPHSLADYKDAKAVVVVFTCNHCPVATAYQDRLIALQKDYNNKGVQVIAICVNKDPADDLDAMKKRAESAGFNFPYLYDPTQQVGRLRRHLHTACLRSGQGPQAGISGRDR